MKLGNVTAVILAGGRGNRMGGVDKGLLTLSGQPLIKVILQSITLQCEHVIINANRHTKQYATYGYSIMNDSLAGFQGPLAGFLVAMEKATTPYIVTVPCDAPKIPDNLVWRLLEKLTEKDADIAVVHDGKRLQPVYALIKTELSNNLKTFLATGDRKIDRWYAQNHTIPVDFSGTSDAFININTPEQYRKLKKQTITKQ